jgi:hypothetical protein
VANRGRNDATRYAKTRPKEGATTPRGWRNHASRWAQPRPKVDATTAEGGHNHAPRWELTRSKVGATSPKGGRNKGAMWAPPCFVVCVVVVGFEPHQNIKKQAPFNILFQKKPSGIRTRVKKACVAASAQLVP